ncbi:hypothetical protein T265_00878 [Opisthorchis viverrini]|uniref:Uncharacterized protein n=1 Tax=Opisthorchis viverrini TaxID=6198 RepID=A0A075ABK0_OPIVI|nr:hypothetical protein T265_00878 [Opisthorchis viverrini]KER33180.1 hypothetical protein T265_00878 [Opisthorchis viverrini]
MSVYLVISCNLVSRLTEIRGLRLPDEPQKVNQGMRMNTVSWSESHRWWYMNWKGGTIILENAEVLGRGLRSISWWLTAEGVEVNKHHSVNRIEDVERACVWRAVLGKSSWQATPLVKCWNIFLRRNSGSRRVCAGCGWRQRVSNEVIRKRVFGCAAGTSIRENIQHHRLRWLGHVLRMPMHRLPRRVLFSVPPSGRAQPRGGQHMTWRKGIKEITKSLGVAGVDGVPATPPVLGWRRCKKWRLIDVSGVCAVSFFPDCLIEWLENIRLTETRELRLPDELQEGRNRSWAVEEFSATL